MVQAFGRRLATNEAFVVSFLVLDVAICVLVGVLSASTGWALVASAAISLPATLCRVLYDRSLR